MELLAFFIMLLLLEVAGIYSGKAMQSPETSIFYAISIAVTISLYSLYVYLRYFRRKKN